MVAAKPECSIAELREVKRKADREKIFRGNQPRAVISGHNSIAISNLINFISFFLCDIRCPSWKYDFGRIFKNTRCAWRGLEKLRVNLLLSSRAGRNTSDCCLSPPSHFFFVRKQKNCADKKIIRLRMTWRNTSDLFIPAGEIHTVFRRSDSRTKKGIF